MQRFQYLKGMNGDDKFLGMKDMFDSLKYQKNSPTKMFSPIDDIMDILYISLLIGIKYNTKINFNDSIYIKGDMTSNWTKGLSQTKDHLIALYISHIIEDKDKKYSDKPEIQKILNIKLGKDPTRSISDEGMIDIHSYAFGGYIELLKRFNNKLPNDLLTFFSNINNLIKDH